MSAVSAVFPSDVLLQLLVVQARRIGEQLEQIHPPVVSG